MQSRIRLAAAVALALAAAPALAEDPAAPPSPTKWLLLDPPDVPARRPVGPNQVFLRYVLDRDASPPAEGEKLKGERGVEVAWTAADAKDGVLDTGRAAYAATIVESDADRVVIASLSGGGTLWVNGDAFAGNVYGYGGFPGVPVPLRKGPNRVLVAGLRGGLSLSFAPCTAPGLGATLLDATLPDASAAEGAWDAGIVVTNASAEPLLADGGNGPVRIAPFGATKIAARAETPKAGGAVVTIRSPQGNVTLRPAPADRGADGAMRLTRISEIDGSVQESAVVQPAPSLAPVPARVVLSLHGAGVDCVGQARSYSRRPGFWIVCPTNRRPFGFDWQDWGRLDAYEALADASDRLGFGLERVCLTGHSMGGHGTWHLASNDPDRFLAIAPSAGWVSFDTYPGPRPATPLSALWRGADGTTDTLSRIGNLAALPTFVVHGTADDNVPVAQAETMLAALREAGANPQVHMEKDAGHWWDDPATPGADCVNLPAVFDLFAAAEPGPPPAKLDWTTADPGVDSRHHWLDAAIPLVYGEPLRIRAEWDAREKTCRVVTTNARRIRIAPPDAVAWTAEIDGAKLAVAGPNVWFERTATGWEASANVQDERKTAKRSGPLKRALARRFAVVLPTKGDAAETRETLARARIDAQQWWVRGNGTWDLVLDTEVLADPARFEGRGLVLYGNADTNAAWTRVLGERLPVDVRRGALRVGDRRWDIASAACFFVRPRMDDAEGMAAVLADTGARGCRLAMSHALFQSGAGYPDFLAWDDRTLADGDGAVLAAGWFDARWDLDGRGFFSGGAEPVREAPGGTK